MTAAEQPAESTETEAGLIPIEGRYLRLGFFVLLLVWLLYLLVTARSWGWEDKLMPYIAGITTLVFLLIKLAKILFPERYEALTPESVGDEELDEIRENLEEAKEDEGPKRSKTAQERYALIMVGWSIALPVLMYFIGFANALPLFIFAFGLQFYDDLVRPVLAAVVFSVFMYVFFIVIIGMQPWDGTLGIPSILKVLGLV